MPTERVGQPSSITLETNRKNGLFTIRDLAVMLGVPQNIVKQKAENVLRKDPLHIKVAGRKRAGQWGKPSLLFDRDNLIELVAQMANLRLRGRKDDSPNLFPSAEKAIKKLTLLLGLSQDDIKHILPPPVPSNQGVHPKEAVKMSPIVNPNEARKKKNIKIRETQQQAAVNLTLNVIQALAQGTLKQLPRNSSELLEMSLPDGFSLNQVIHSFYEDPKKAEKVRVYCVGFFLDTLKILWEKRENPSSKESITNPKEEQILEHLKTIRGNKYDIKKIVNQVCNHFSLPTPVEYKDI